jgi:hypothetical protein
MKPRRAESDAAPNFVVAAHHLGSGHCARLPENSLRYLWPFAAVGEDPQTKEKTMSRYPNVRNKPKAKPQPEFSPSVEDAVLQAAREMFEQRGGLDLETGLAGMRETLELYREEIQRARKCEDRDSFKWLVKPSEGIRAEREIERLTRRIDELFTECVKNAREIAEHMMKQARAEKARESRRQSETRPQQQEPTEPSHRTEDAKPDTASPPDARAA